MVLVVHTCLIQKMRKVRLRLKEIYSLTSRIPSDSISQRIHFSESKANFSHFLYQTSMNNNYHTRYNLTLQVSWTFTCIILTITILSNPHITIHYRPPPLRMRSFAPFYSRPSSMKSLHFASYRRTERWGLWKVVVRVLVFLCHFSPSIYWLASRK